MPERQYSCINEETGTLENINVLKEEEGYQLQQVYCLILKELMQTK